MPDWADPVAHYMLHDGLSATLRIAAYAVVGSTLIGVLLGTLLTIRFWPLQALIRLYVEVWRGLPILVTIFRSRRPPAALCSRSRASSTRLRRHSASAGSGATAA